MDDNQLKKIIALNVRAYRAKYNYKQTELADLANITQSQLSIIERGITIPKISTLAKLAEVFHIPVDDLLKSHF